MYNLSHVFHDYDLDYETCPSHALSVYAPSNLIWVNDVTWYRRPIIFHAMVVPDDSYQKYVAKNRKSSKQVRPSSGTAVYPHMPMACPTCPVRSPSVKGTSVYRYYLPPRADSSDLGLLRSKVPQITDSALDAHEPPCKISRRKLYPRRINS